MALKTCPHCGHSVSDQATKCPSCGKDPRYTDFQLDQQEQQHKKKRKKTFLISGAALVVVLAVLCVIYIPRYIDYSHKMEAYREAQAFYDSGEYVSAVSSFEALGDFKDSAQKALDSRYQYICGNKSHTDPVTEKYIEYLTSKNYPNIQSLADSIYGWKFNAYVTDSAAGYPVYGTFGKNSPLYVRFTAFGGKPGETVSVEYWVDYYVSPYASSLGYSDKTESGSIPYKIRNGDIYYAGWEHGIGTIKYSRVKFTFYNAATLETLAIAEAYISE